MGETCATVGVCVCVCVWRHLCHFSSVRMFLSFLIVWAKYVNVFNCLGPCVRVYVCVWALKCVRDFAALFHSVKVRGKLYLFFSKCFKGAPLKWWAIQLFPTSPPPSSWPQLLPPTPQYHSATNSLPSHHPPHGHHGNWVHTCKHVHTHTHTYIHPAGYRG